MPTLNRKPWMFGGGNLTSRLAVSDCFSSMPTCKIIFSACSICYTEETGELLWSWGCPYCCSRRLSRDCNSDYTDSRPAPLAKRLTNFCIQPFKRKSTKTMNDQHEDAESGQEHTSIARLVTSPSRPAFCSLSDLGRPLSAVQGRVPAETRPKMFEAIPLVASHSQMLLPTSSVSLVLSVTFLLR